MRGVLGRVARRDAVGHRVDELRRDLRRRRAGDAEVERERGVEALVGRALRVEEVAHAAAVRVAVPARDRQLGHDRGEAGRVCPARGDHVGRRAVVGAADHRDLAARPRLRGERVHEVDAGLLLLRPAVVPAAARVAGAEHVRHRPRVALRDVALAEVVVREVRARPLRQRVVGREGEDHRHRAAVRRAGDLDVEPVAVDGRDRQRLVDRLRLRGGGAEGERDQRDDEAPRQHGDTNGRRALKLAAGGYQPPRGAARLRLDRRRLRLRRQRQRAAAGREGLQRRRARVRPPLRGRGLRALDVELAPVPVDAEARAARDPAADPVQGRVRSCRGPASAAAASSTRTRSTGRPSGSSRRDSGRGWPTGRRRSSRTTTWPSACSAPRRSRSTTAATRCCARSPRESASRTRTASRPSACYFGRPGVDASSDPFFGGEGPERGRAASAAARAWSAAGSARRTRS